ncbi:DUF4160 domain-containing protein [Pararobbsia alpina]|uniref:DUF4160 domain-containing protein n=1 Tax=Pararobbsia alpina TaxID=621374 RepID=UPI001FEB35D3|nr:DUF4160 domain-containing protein [Pararobbsia alpina]
MCRPSARFSESSSACTGETTTLHFHARYGDFEALIRIDTLEVIRGSLPKRALALVLEWASEHRAELNEDWELCRALATPKPISPLE